MEHSNAVIRGLLATAPDALIAVDSSGTIVYVSDQAERLFGCARAQLIGESVDTLVPDRFRATHARQRTGYLLHPIARQMGAGLDLRARRYDGTEFPAEISLSSFDTEHGRLTAAAIRDVTDSRRLEQKLKAVLASTPEAIIGVSSSGVIELANSQTERLFGWTSEELLGQSVEVLVPDATRSLHRTHRAAFLRDPQVRPMGAGRTLWAQRKDGSQFPTEVSLSPVADDEVGLVLAAIRDITERIAWETERQQRALEAERERTQRLESIGHLAGGVAHDFNNLLGVILNYTTLIARHTEDDQTQTDLAEIRAAAERGASLTRQLLTFARRDLINPEPVDVVEVIRGVVAMLNRTLGEHIALEFELAESPLVVLADRHQLEQILLNLAINARDAMPEGGTLRICAEADGAGRVVVQVSDDGEGMPAGVVEKAFEPFFTTKDRTKGSGLGLATVYGIVSRLGGEIALESEVGQGTRLAITLPECDHQPGGPAEEPAAPGGGQERILLVEDEEPLRVGTARLLGSYGYEVIVASDGIAALELFEEQAEDIDLILTDVAMPRMRGDVFAAKVGATHPGTPMIFMSGYDSGNTPLTGRLLPKPVDETELLRTIREVLDAQ